MYYRVLGDFCVIFVPVLSIVDRKENHPRYFRLRMHTKSHHSMTITEYKERFGAELIPVEVVWHECGVCGELVMLDSDHIAIHLKKGGIVSLSYQYQFCNVLLRTPHHHPQRLQ